MPHLKKKGFVLIYATLVNKGLICHGLAGDPEMSRLGRDVWVTMSSVSFAMQVEEPVLVGKHANAIGLNHIFAICYENEVDELDTPTASSARAIQK